jgi:hypothetical protein
MQIRLMLLRAHTFLADVSVLTPPAPGQARLFADHPANGAGLKQVSDRVSGVCAPHIHNFPFFSHSCEFVVA